MINSNRNMHQKSLKSIMWESQSFWRYHANAKYRRSEQWLKNTVSWDRLNWFRKSAIFHSISGGIYVVDNSRFSFEVFHTVRWFYGWWRNLFLYFQGMWISYSHLLWYFEFNVEKIHDIVKSAKYWAWYMIHPFTVNELSWTVFL